MAAEQISWHVGTGGMRRRVLATLMLSLYDPVPEVRFWCAFALASISRRDDVRRAIPRLRELLPDAARIDGFWTVGEEAAWAIMTITHAAWPTPGEPEYQGPPELPPLTRRERRLRSRLGPSRGRRAGPTHSAET
jgi:hypothetical protein